jgi:hypothetical protein
MKINKTFITAITFMLFIKETAAQRYESGGWLFLSHSQKISDKFNVLADLQLRSADRFKYWNVLLSRTALSYEINKSHTVAVGYAYLGEWEKEDGTKTYSREHRIYEQYQYEFRLKRTEFTIRARLEQRFQKDEGIIFSQRARAFASVQIPLRPGAEFENGPYLKIQNEIFLNVQNSKEVNGSIFDQNRPYGALGLRVNKKLDVEIGYMRWLQRESEGNLYRHTFQIMVMTNF